MTAHARETHFTELIDPAVVADTFVEGIGEIETIGENCVRVTLYASRSIGRGQRERIVVARLVLTEQIFQRSLRQCTVFLSGEAALDEETTVEGACH